MFRYPSHGRALVAALGLFVPYGTVSAQAVTTDTLIVSLPEALSLAVDANPELAARSWDPVAARGDLRQASVFAFNPELRFESRAPSDGLGERYEAELGLEIEIAGQRGLRTRAAREGLLSADSRFRDDGRLVLADVARSYHRLVAAEERVALLGEIEASNERLAAAVRTQLAEGEVSVLEANFVAVEAARARARAIQERSLRATAILELSRMLGVDAERGLRTVGPGASSDNRALSSLEDALRRARVDRPDVQAREREVEWARQVERLARRERLPKLRLAALATREDPLVDPRFGVAIGLEIPLFNRSQGVTDRRTAEVSTARAELRATETIVRLEVEDAHRRYQTASREVELLEGELLGPSRENQRLLDIAYREGKIDLASLLLVRNQLLDAELAYWDAWERRERSLTDLRSATGAILEGVTFTPGIDR